MWSHYASFHSGICVRFKHSPSEFLFGQSLDVNYNSKRSVINPVRDGDPRETIVDILLSKADYWAYEEELRITDPAGPGLKSFDPDLLDGVYMGARITPEHRDAILGWAQDRGSLEVFQGRLDETEYRLVFDRIDLQSR